MPKKRLIREGWYKFAEHVLPKNAGEDQKRESRRAYYAGAAYLWQSFLENLGPGEEADPPDLALAAGVTQEIQDWFEDLKSGKA